jgi:hypothetical protein
MNLTENFKIVQASWPATTNGGITCDYVSLKNVKKAYILVEMNQAVGHATALAPKQASKVDGTGVKALSNACSIWANEDVVTSDTLVKQTDATTYTVAADVKKKQIVFEIEPSISFDIANGFDCLGLAIADSSQATDFASVTYILETRYPQATPPAAITD